MGAMFGGVPGAIIGGVIGTVYGSMTGYLDAKEAERDAKREQIQREIDERGAVADELKQIRELMQNSESGVYIDSDRVGTSLLKGAAMVKPSYNI